MSAHEGSAWQMTREDAARIACAPAVPMTGVTVTLAADHRDLALDRYEAAVATREQARIHLRASAVEIDSAKAAYAAALAAESKAADEVLAARAALRGAL